MEQASPKSHWKPLSAETKLQWMNGAVSSKNFIKGQDGRAGEDLFSDVIKLCAKLN